MAATRNRRRTSRARGSAEDASVAEAEPAALAPAASSKLRVFISWSGARSRALAHALRQQLPLMLHYVEPWMSETDIYAGKRWSEAVANELEASNFGIICVTQSKSAPWLLFSREPWRSPLRAP